uniref:Uncharacterized protein n=1 Tax=Anopheles coluzzii TaxID=1518534 RepID=A0A8W7PA86_ANOCL
MWGEVLYGAGHQYDTALLPALVRQRPFGGLWPPEEPPAARSARKRPRAAHGARPEAATHHGVVGVGAGSYGFCSPAAPATTTTGLMQGGVLPKPLCVSFLYHFLHVKVIGTHASFRSQPQEILHCVTKFSLRLAGIFKTLLRPNGVDGLLFIVWSPQGFRLDLVSGAHWDAEAPFRAGSSSSKPLNRWLLSWGLGIAVPAHHGHLPVPKLCLFRPARENATTVTAGTGRKPSERPGAQCPSNPASLST